MKPFPDIYVQSYQVEVFNLLNNLTCVFAHPDDEFLAAGLLARAKRIGYKTHIICGTNGERGRLKGQNFLGDKTEDLVTIRNREFKKSSKLLEVDSLKYLNLPDNKAAQWNLYDAVGELESILLNIGPSIIVTFNKNGGNNHPDHIGIHNITVKAFKKIASQNYKLYFGTLFPKQYSQANNILQVPPQIIDKITIDDNEVSKIIKLSNDEYKLKLNVIDVYRSQFPDEHGLYYKMPLKFLEMMAKYECYEAFDIEENQDIEIVNML
ncbi:hypothetical protein DQG23_28310 [Paenibacillus contaminans]|uniref:PIG-L family deacetylase n=1 Tax=Paenibacillus contaminans TaxID=450362 RepID=A0A329MA92_9BACL|nr:hypothetical protein DQG23_28310 [Paenibacillus contaminans]